MGIKNFLRKFRKDDMVIDLSDMQKRGLLEKRKLDEPEKSQVVDLTESKTEDNSALGFLGSLAGVSNTASETTSETASETASVVSTVSEPVSFTFDRKTKLRGILRDIKAKIDGTSDKIYKLSDRLDLLERKIERLERRTGV